MKIKQDDVSSQTGHSVKSAVCRWRAELTSTNASVDCLAAVDASGHLILFESAGSWQASNLSDLLNRRFSQVQPVYARLSRLMFDRAGHDDDPAASVDVLMLPDETGHLLLCHRDLGATWAVTDISVDCEVTIDRSCRPVAWQQSDISVTSLHVLAVDPSGALVEFSRQVGGVWCHRSTGARSTAGSLCLPDADTLENNASLDSFRIAFSINPEGLLCKHVRLEREEAGWQHESVSSIDTPRLRPHSTTAFLLHGQYHVAACDVFGSVLIYQQTEDGASQPVWLTTDVTAQTGCRVRAVDAAMILQADANPQSGTGRGGNTGQPSSSIVLSAHGNGRAYRFWWSNQEQWQVTDLAEALGVGTRLAVHPGLSQVHDESIAMVTDGQLSVYHGLEAHRSMSRRLIARGSASGHPVFSRKRSLLCRVIASHDDQSPVPELRAIGEAVFGSRTVQRNATSYLDYVSGGAFTLQRDDVVGWLNTTRSEAWSVSETGNNGQDSNNQTLLSSDQVRHRFQRAIHSEPSNHWEVVRESGVQGVANVPDSACELIIAAYLGRAPQMNHPEFLVQWPVEKAISVIRLVQEILIGCTRLPRLPHEASEYDLMALDPNPDTLGESRFLHPNGAWKLLLGWVRPRLVTRSAQYHLRAISDSREVIVLVREASHPIEYFVLENRQRRPMDDVHVPGLLVWHVLNVQHDSGCTAETINASAGWQVTLAAALTSAESSIERLDWADGRVSGYTLSNVSPIADVMSFDVGTVD